MSINIKKREKKDSTISRLASNEFLTDELNQTDKKVVSYIRNGLDNHKGYSLSQELCLHRKKLLGIVDETEWNDYVSFVNACIAKAKEND